MRKLSRERGGGGGGTTQCSEEIEAVLEVKIDLRQTTLNIKSYKTLIKRENNYS